MTTNNFLVASIGVNAAIVKISYRGEDVYEICVDTTDVDDYNKNNEPIEGLTAEVVYKGIIQIYADFLRLCAGAVEEKYPHLK